VFTNAIYFHPSLIFVGEAMSLPLEWSLIRSSTLIGLDCKYWTTVEVNDSGKHSSLLQYSNNGTKHFKNVNNRLNTRIYSYLETSGGQSSNLYLNVVHFFNASVN
jgi:hypothetical protein